VENPDNKAAAPRGRWAQRAEGQNLVLKHQDGRTIDASPGMYMC